MCRKFAAWCQGTYSIGPYPRLIEIAERAGARAARIAARTASSSLSRRTRGAFCRHGKHTELRAQLPAFALGTLGLVAAEDQSFKLVLTFLTDVFKNRHESLPWDRLLLILESICGNFANWSGDAQPLACGGKFDKLAG